MKIQYVHFSSILLNIIKKSNIKYNSFLILLSMVGARAILNFKNIDLKTKIKLKN
jgi:hypothetical protein